MSPRRHMVALLRNTALCASVLSKNGTVYWGMPDLVLSVGSDVNKLCDVGWMTWESVSASEQRGSESITWHCGEVSELTCVKDLVTSLSLASRVGHCEKLWVLGVCVCVCVRAHMHVCYRSGLCCSERTNPHEAHELPGGTWGVQSST